MFFILKENIYNNIKMIIYYNNYRFIKIINYFKNYLFFIYNFKEKLLKKIYNFR